MTPPALAGPLEILSSVIKVLERNEQFQNLNPRCEPLWSFRAWILPNSSELSGLWRSRFCSQKGAIRWCEGASPVTASSNQAGLEPVEIVAWHDKCALQVGNESHESILFHYL
jgi:hypothetical protein